MKMLKVNQLQILFPAMFCALLMSSCYIDTTSPDERSINDKNLWDPEACRVGKYDADVGCLQISLPSSPDITVANKQFRDAAEFGASLAQIVQIDDRNAAAAPKPSTPETTPESKDNPKPKDESQSQPSVTYKVESAEPITNDSWAKDFKLYFKGPKDFNGNSNFSAGFAIQDLPESAEYRARLQKEVMFNVTKITTFKKLDGSKDADIKPTQEVFKRCVTLYKEFAFEVRSRTKTKLQIDQFDMYKPQESCGSKVSGDPTVTL